MQRISVYIDGSNLYRSLKALNCATMDFYFRRFVDSFVSERHLVRKGYYIGQVRRNQTSSHSNALYRHQQILFDLLQKAGFEIVLGHLRELDGVFTEKGVDVRLAVDIIEHAHENRYDTVLLISSDGDLAPAIESVRKRGKRAEVVSFPNRTSYSLIQNADQVHYINTSVLQRFTKLL